MLNYKTIASSQCRYIQCMTGPEQLHTKCAKMHNFLFCFFSINCIYFFLSNHLIYKFVMSLAFKVFKGVCCPQ